MIKTPDRTPAAQLTVTLQKHAYSGGDPLGTEFTWTYTRLPLFEAEARCWARFKKENPDENPLDWRLKRGAA